MIENINSLIFSRSIATKTPGLAIATVVYFTDANRPCQCRIDVSGSVIVFKYIKIIFFIF